MTGDRETLHHLVWSDGDPRPAADVLVAVQCWLTQRPGALAKAVRAAMSKMHGRRLMAWLREVSHG